MKHPVGRKFAIAVKNRNIVRKKTKAESFVVVFFQSPNYHRKRAIWHKYVFIKCM